MLTLCGKRDFPHGAVQLVFSFEHRALLPGHLCGSSALPWYQGTSWKLAVTEKPGFAPLSEMESSINAVGPHQDTGLDQMASLAARQLVEGRCPPGVRRAAKAQQWQSPMALGRPRTDSAAPSPVPFQACSPHSCYISTPEFEANEHNTRSWPCLLFPAA